MSYIYYCIYMNDIIRRKKYNEGKDFYLSLIKMGYNPNSKDMVSLKQTLNNLKTGDKLC